MHAQKYIVRFAMPLFVSFQRTYKDVSVFFLAFMFFDSGLCMLCVTNLSYVDDIPVHQRW